jgi:hypothetical protein
MPEEPFNWLGAVPFPFVDGETGETGDGTQYPFGLSLEQVWAYYWKVKSYAIAASTSVTVVNQDPPPATLEAPADIAETPIAQRVANAYLLGLPTTTFSDANGGGASGDAAAVITVQIGHYPAGLFVDGLFWPKIICTAAISINSTLSGNGTSGTADYASDQFDAAPTMSFICFFPDGSDQTVPMGFVEGSGDDTIAGGSVTCTIDEEWDFVA